MGVSASWSDIIQAVIPWTESHAETPENDQENDTDVNAEGVDEINAPSPEGEQENEEEEKEEEEEELVDPKETIEEECRNSKACSPAKHHYEECVERVTCGKAVKNEDCVEEFFHLVHCASNCAAPKLWQVLK